MDNTNYVEYNRKVKELYIEHQGNLKLIQTLFRDDPVKMDEEFRLEINNFKERLQNLKDEYGISNPISPLQPLPPLPPLPIPKI